MKKILVTFVFLLTSISYPFVADAMQEYIVQVAHNDEFFIINDEKFKARTWCMHMNEGDRVIFIEGSPNGVCVSAVIYDLTSKEKCDVYCE